MDTTETRAPTWIEPAGQGDGAFARASKRRALEDDDPNGLQGRHIGTTDGGTEDHENAGKLQAATNDAAMESPTLPAPPTPSAEEHAALERRRQEAWDLAQDQDVQVSHETIARMGSEELEEWITTNLM